RGPPGEDDPGGHPTGDRARERQAEPSPSTDDQVDAIATKGRAPRRIRVPLELAYESRTPAQSDQRVTAGADDLLVKRLAVPSPTSIAGSERQINADAAKAGHLLRNDAGRRDERGGAKVRAVRVLGQRARRNDREHRGRS